MIDFLGFIVNFQEVKLSLAQDTDDGYSKGVYNNVELPKQVSALQLEGMIGLLSTAISAILPILLHYQSLHQVKNRLVLSGGYKNTSPVVEEEQLELNSGYKPFTG